MLYFKGVSLKNKRVVAIGYDPKNVMPTSSKVLNYVAITKQQYAELNKTFLNATISKHKKLAR